MPRFTKAQVQRVEYELQALYDRLSEAEKPVLEAILSRAAEDPEVIGHMELFGGVVIDLGAPDPGAPSPKSAQKMTIKFGPESTRWRKARGVDQ